MSSFATQLGHFMRDNFLKIAGSKVSVTNDAGRFALTTALVRNGSIIYVSGTGLYYLVVDQTQLGIEAGYAVQNPAGPAVLQFRQGLEADFAAITPAAGEPIWQTDTNRLRIGNGSTLANSLRYFVMNTAQAVNGSVTGGTGTAGTKGGNETFGGTVQIRSGDGGNSTAGSGVAGNGGHLGSSPRDIMVIRGGKGGNSSGTATSGGAGGSFTNSSNEAIFLLLAGGNGGSSSTAFAGGQGGGADPLAGSFIYMVGGTGGAGGSGHAGALGGGFSGPLLKFVGGTGGAGGSGAGASGQGGQCNAGLIAVGGNGGVANGTFTGGQGGNLYSATIDVFGGNGGNAGTGGNGGAGLNVTQALIKAYVGNAGNGDTGAAGGQGGTWGYIELSGGAGSSAVGAVAGANGGASGQLILSGAAASGATAGIAGAKITGSAGVNTYVTSETSPQTYTIPKGKGAAGQFALNDIMTLAASASEVSFNANGFNETIYDTGTAAAVALTFPATSVPGQTFTYIQQGGSSTITPGGTYTLDVGNSTYTPAAKVAVVWKSTTSGHYARIQ